MRNSWRMMNHARRARGPLCAIDSPATPSVFVRSECPSLSSRGLTDPFKQFRHTNSHCQSDIKKPFVQYPSAAVFDVHQHVSRHPRQESKLLLGKAPLNPKLLNTGAHLMASTPPGSDALRVILTGASRHAFK